MEMGATEIEAIIKLARGGMKVLAERVLTLTGMLACIGIFGWALYDGAWAATATASAFAVLVFWPVIRLETRKKE